MGFKTVDYVLQNIFLPHSKKIVLIALAKHVNDKHALLECWPSTATLATISGMSERHVQRILKELVNLNYVEVIEKGNGRRSTRYRLHLEPSNKSTSSLGVTSCHPSTPQNNNSRGDTLSFRSDTLSEQKTPCHPCPDTRSPESVIEVNKESIIELNAPTGKENVITKTIEPSSKEETPEVWKALVRSMN